MEFNINVSNNGLIYNNIRQHHANNVDPVLMSKHYSYTKHR